MTLFMPPLLRCTRKPSVAGQVVGRIQHGFWLSVVVIASGVVLVAAWNTIEKFQDAFHRPISTFRLLIARSGLLSPELPANAKRITRVVQNGSLPVYLAVILLVAAIAPTIVAFVQ